MDGEGSILSSDITDISTADGNGIGRSASQVRRISRVCLVGQMRHDFGIINALKALFDVEIFESEDGYDYIRDSNIVFICGDFINCHNFKYIHSCHKSIMGPAIIRKRFLDGMPLMIPRPSRPIYTDSMSGVIIALSGLSTKQCREAVDLIHFMGGGARKVFSATTTHLITDTARGKNYRMAVSIGCRVMHSEWLRAAWAVRDEIDVDVVSIDFMTKYTVEPFCGLILWFVAFSVDDLVEMKRKTIEHRGRIAKTQEEASHIVVSTSLDASVQEVDSRQHLVSCEWFWISVQLNCCANEKIYQWKEQKGAPLRRTIISPTTIERASRFNRKSVSKSSIEILDSSNASGLPDYSEHLLSSEDFDVFSGSPKKTDRRQAVCKEMLETEENYLKALKLIIQVYKEPLEAQINNPDAGLLTKAEISQIFSRVAPLIDAHEKICYTLQSYVLHWLNDRLIGKVWLDHVEDLTPIYKSFINSYDTALQTLDQCDHSKPKFHAFLKAAESRAECQRNSLRDLLVRPVQRLPSVILLLKAILKKTDRNNPDNSFLVRAARALETILTLANESRRRNESYAEIFKISSEIERCPADILSSARTLKAELHVYSLGGEDEWAKTRDKRMAIFLFNDLIEIVKVKMVTDFPTPTKKTFSTGTLSRQLSFSLLRHDKKRFKHYQQYMLASIRLIENIIVPGAPGIFIISFRMSQGEDFWIAQCVENQTGELKKFLQELADQIYKLVGRQTLMEDIHFGEDPTTIGDKETMATIRKALSHAVRCSSAPQPPPITTRPSNQFRRAMSSMQIGLSNTLSRFHSRSNLRSIDEHNEQAASSPRTISFATPTRGIRQMLSSSTFLPSRLSRRDSIFSHSVKE